MSSAFASVTIATVLLASVAGCPGQTTHRKEHEAQPLLQLQLATVQENEVPSYVELAGTVIGQVRVPLSTKLMTEIKQLQLEVGQRVEAGQVLAVLDDREIAAMRSEAAAFLAEAQAALSEVQAVRRQGEAGVVQAQAALDQSQAALADAQRDLERSTALFAESVVPRAQLEKAQLAVQVAEQNVARSTGALAQARGAVAQAESKAPQVEARKQQATAKDLQAASLQEYAVLRAPFAGIVTAKYFEQGQLSVPGQPIVVVEQSTGQRVSASVPADLAAQLKVGGLVEVHSETVGEPQYEAGSIAVLGIAADPASRTVPIEVELASATRLISGQFIRLRIADGEIRRRLVVPPSAVVREGELCYVWRVSPDGVAARVSIEAGRADGQAVEVLRGLFAGEQVVVVPADQLYDGAHVALGQVEE